MAHNPAAVEAHMQKRILVVAAGAILCAGGFAVAQNRQTEIRLKADTGMVARADMVANQASGPLTLIGGVSIEVNGVLVRADRAVVNQREVTLEGNVRTTLKEDPDSKRIRYSRGVDVIGTAVVSLFW
jgi:lipopolysaccharide assembly outer membrane protein LptD (OstA)